MRPSRLLLSAVTVVALGAGPAAAAPAMRADDARLASLSLAVTPASGPGDTLVVLYSGDGGWAKIDRGLADGFVRAGLPVVGYDSLRYFWTPRTPEGAAADLAVVLRHYLAAFGKARVILAGYSFGADALPAIVTRLPADLRARVRLVALVGAERQGELRLRPTSWMGVHDPAAFPVADALAQLKGLPVICVYGAGDASAACPAFAPEGVRSLRVAGGHHYDGDYGAVSRAILDALPR
jgi:type IV secretory pathway VirJ component